MASTVMTALTNSQSSIGYTNKPHYLPRRFHTTNTGPSAGQQRFPRGTRAGQYGASGWPGDISSAAGAEEVR